jgi:hypothetical protein
VVSQAVPWYGSDYDERLLIHLSYSPRRCCIFLLFTLVSSPNKSMWLLAASLYHFE